MVLTFVDLTFVVVAVAVAVVVGVVGVVNVAFVGVVPGLVGQQLHTQVFAQLFMRFLA